MDSFENDHSVIAEYTPRSENYFDISCKIVERNETIFEVKTFAGSREQAKQIVDNWKSYAIQIYPKMIETLTANYAELNPEINTDDSPSNIQDEEKNDDTIVQDNEPVDGNINLFDDEM